MTQNSLNTIFSSLSEQPGRISEVEAVVEQCVNDFDLRQAQALAKQLESVVAAMPEALQPQLRGLATRLKILALPLYWNREDILNPFRVGLGGALTYETPEVTQRIKAKFLDFPLSERDQWRQDIVTTMHQNKDEITSRGPGDGTQNMRGTVATWLRDYDRTLGVDIIDDVKITGYLFRSQSAKSITPAERETLIRLFRLYEYLKLSSTTALGIEEELDIVEGGVIKDFNRGRPVTILDLTQGVRVASTQGPLRPVAERPIESSGATASLGAKTQPLEVPSPPAQKELVPSGPTTLSLLASTAVAAETRRLGTGFQPEKIRDELWSALAKRSQPTVLAATKLLAASGELVNVVRTDSRFYYLLANYYQAEKRLNDLKDFHMSSTNPRYTKELVRYLLEVALKLGQNDAAHIGVDLVNILRQKGEMVEHWAYYDMSSQSYRWL